MAVTVADSAEFILEEAWLAALQNNVDLVALVSAGGGIQRAQDYSDDLDYPIVLVECMGAMDDPDGTPLDGDYLGEVVIDGRTEKDDDLTGRIVNRIKRQIRNTLETDGLFGTMETVGQLHIYGILVQDEQLALDGEFIRSRGLVIDTRFSVENFPPP